MTVSGAPRIVVLAGGVGGSKFVVGVREAARRQWPDAAGGTRAEITVIANTGDDLWLSGLRLQPDVDSMIYALAGVNDTERGWGRTGESERVAAELHAWGAGWPWFTLGDPRSRRPHRPDGVAARGRFGHRGGRPARVALATRGSAAAHDGCRGRHAGDDRSGPHALPGVVDPAPGIASGAELRLAGRRALRAGAGVLEALAEADAILFAPSNPVVSIGPILAVPGIAEAVRAASGTVVGVSPIIAGAPVRGMADACLAAVGIPAAADAVGRHYGARATGGVLDAWVIAEEDAALAPGLEAEGLRAPVRPLWMRDLDTSARLAADALDVALPARSRSPEPGPAARAAPIGQRS